jgi:outer membrane protein OmpA-like peptidoglycan-associated protein
MSVNILEQVTSHFSNDIIDKLGKFMGTDSSLVKTALTAALPAVLGGIAGKGATSQGASEILEMITKGGFGASTLSGLSQALSGGDSTQSMLATGAGLLKRIFGERTDGVIEGVGNSSGMSKGTSSSLLGLAVPVILGVLGKHTNESRLDAAGLMGLLAGQSGFIKNALPAGLAGLIGLPGISGSAGQMLQPKNDSIGAYIKWFLPLILGGVLFSMFFNKGCQTPPVTTPVEKVTTAPSGAIDKLGAFMATRLPNGVELNIPEFGIEKKLIAFIEDPNKPVDKTTWFSFDRLEFETGSATLKPSSAEQLKNIAEIMKAYPKVTLKLGGYTDNVGNPASNLKLSQQRAESTMRELVTLGVEAGRLEAEGYGEQHPIGDNATAEGRQMNRRIDLRVTNK